jgi:Lon protease-like protein
MNADVDYPDRVGIMILPWVSLFPGCLLPLHIFENRYREMCTKALSGNRMFAIAHGTQENDYEQLGGLGVIRAGVTKPDGTMDIILQGVTRVGFSDFQMKPYPQASIRILNDPAYDPDSYADLRRDLMNALKVNLETTKGLPKEALDYIDQIEAPGAFTDMVASTLVLNPNRRRQLLLESDVQARMLLLLEYLVAERAES